MDEAPGYLHAIDGRIRVKVPRVKGSPVFTRLIEEKLAALEGLKEVSANLTTGNVLVLYDSKALDPDRIMKKIKEVGGFDTHPGTTVPSLSFNGESPWTFRPNDGKSLASPIAEKVLSIALEAALQRLIVALI